MNLYSQTWYPSQPDSKFQEYVREENSIYRQAKENSLNDHVMGFTCAFSSRIKSAFNKNGYSFSSSSLMKLLEPSREILNKFCKGEIDIEVAMEILFPIVSESLMGLSGVNSRLHLRETLTSIQKIKI